MDEAIHDITVSAYRIPTDAPESDGTLEWNCTTMILVEIQAAEKTGLGYTYADASVATFIDKYLKTAILGQDAMDTGRLFAAMSTAIRNEGHCGMAYMALSAVDTALWDLKAKLLSQPLCRLIGMVRQEAEIYGSGGFTSYSDDQLREQLGQWASQGMTCVKMKIGRHPGKDTQRIETVRKAIGPSTELFVDANGAYTITQALVLADACKQQGVTWFEEPVSSDNLKGLKFIRDHGPLPIRIAAGEYGYAPRYFLDMLQAEAVDVLQADATRCGGITGLLKIGMLCEVFQTPFSFHCAPALHLHAALCINPFSIGEYFHDHARIEQLLFDGAPKPVGGMLKPDLTRPGLGLDFKHANATKYKVY